MMNLKKIDSNLQKGLMEAGLSEPSEVLAEVFSTIKSGTDCLIIAPPGSGKSTAIVVNVIQQLKAAGEESPRALIMVSDKEKVLAMEELFDTIGSFNELRVYGVHDRGDLEYDKNYISTGIDVLIGTPTRLNEMFTTAGYNVNRLRMFIVDQAETLLAARHEPKLMRISNSIAKTQRLIFSDVDSEKLEIFTEKFLNDPFIFDFLEEEE